MSVNRLIQPVLAGFLRACPEPVEGKDAKIVTNPININSGRYIIINR